MFIRIRPLLMCLMIPGVLLCLSGCQNRFEAEDIHTIAKEVSGMPVEESVDGIMQRLQDRYPDMIRGELQWHFNYTGGTLGQMAIVYASLNEYILIFGTPIGAEGFSGRYAAMDVYDCMFAGEMRTYTEGDLQPTVYLPGDMAVLERGNAKGYSMAPGTWMLEYTRGNTVRSLPQGLFAPTGLTLDFTTMFSVFTDYAGLVISSFFM